MKRHNWNNEKNAWLKKHRGIGFEEIIVLVTEGNYLEIIENPNKSYPNQSIYVIDYQDYIYLVPFVENEIEVFLKTIIPSRKATKKYLGGKQK